MLKKILELRDEFEKSVSFHIRKISKYTEWLEQELIKERQKNKLQSTQRECNPLDKKDLEQFMNDFDNLIDTGHFSKEKAGDFAAWHKNLSIKEIACKSREFCRILSMWAK